MRQAILNQAIARATGEPLEVIRRLGFTESSHDGDWDSDGEMSPQFLDWDEVDRERARLIPYFVPRNTNNSVLRRMHWTPPF